MPVRNLETTLSDSASHYRQQCSSWREVTYTRKTEDAPNGNLDLVANGQDRIHQMQVLLAGSDESCIRIRGEPFDDEYVFSAPDVYSR